MHTVCRPICVRRHGECLAWLVPLLVYVAVAIPLYLAYCDMVNPDGFCYARRAAYLARGQWWASISGYWSPLICWCMAPLLRCGMDGVHAARVVLGLGGAGLVLAFGWMLRAVLEWHWGLRLAAASLLAPAAAAMAMRQISPDTLLGAVLMGYLALAGRRDLLERRWIAVGAGLLGGLAYLAKAYAFPFVLVHLPLTIAMLAWMLRRQGRFHTGRNAMVSITLALAGFALLAGPWVAVLSWRYGQLTISTSGARAHAQVGPGDAGSAWDWNRPVPDPYIIPPENHEFLRCAFWSPFSSRQAWSHQLHVVRNNAQTLDRTFRLYAPVGLALAGIALLPLTMWLQPRGRRWQGIWLGLTLALYCAGYLPVYFHPRYIHNTAFPLSLAICMGSVLQRRRPRLGVILAAAVLAA
ncbi:MAG: hypothetical protein ABSH20_16645, partial [Tepidisphaeraceae bacterium]